MSDVTAVLLTLGEATTERARDSIRRQTAAPADIVEVRDVRPFHRALNEAVRRIRTTLLLQVDADMVLDPRCVEALCAPMRAHPHVGIVLGLLRDPLVGRVEAVKLYRRQCLDLVGMRDTISPDTDFIAEIRQRGWYPVYVLDWSGDDPSAYHTVGAHLPDYSPRYTWHKYILEGARYRYRGDLAGLGWHAGVLDRSAHPAAPFARMALLSGAFEDLRSDALGRPPAAGPFDRLEQLMAGRTRLPIRFSRLAMGLSPTPSALFRRFHRIGVRLRSRMAWPSFDEAMGALARTPDPMRWVAQAGLCRGVLTDGDPAIALAADLDSLREMLPARSGWLGTRVRAVARMVARARSEDGQHIE